MCSVYCWALKQLVISTSRLCCLSLFFLFFFFTFYSAIYNKKNRTGEILHCTSFLQKGSFLFSLHKSDPFLQLQKGVSFRVWQESQPLHYKDSPNSVNLFIKTWRDFGFNIQILDLSLIGSSHLFHSQVSALEGFWQCPHLSQGGADWPIILHLISFYMLYICNRSAF